MPNAHKWKGMLVKRRTWDTWLVVVVMAYLSAAVFLNVSRQIMSDTALPTVMLWNWVVVQSKALNLCLSAFSLLWVVGIIVAVLSNSRLGWWYATVLLGLQVTQFIPGFLIAPIGGEAPFISALPSAIGVIVTIIIALIIAPQVYWVLKHKGLAFDQPGAI